MNIKEWEIINIWDKICIISSIYNEKEIEIIYIDYQNRAINEDAILINNQRIFKNILPSWWYADKSTRLRKYVNELRYYIKH